ncbi:Putative nucleic acid binding protein [Nitrosotalea devaniterrae]|uniref:Nucleic acid binding protein n=1 Tax=Nitrosotalea devaniterrae TaxID=1078905 RepID=A0A128A0J6_9ARCH|nr:Putative nucleic acid binding protein [Candidatus Nitrosotalea devanaterra]
MLVYQVVKIICDSSFLIILASRRIKNISSVETEIGSLEYVVPNMVVKELEKITMNNKKKALLKTH